MYPDEKDEVVQLYLDDIIPNRFQPREIFDERALKELAISIKEHGVIQPIIVRKNSNGKYEIIAGERRYKASALAGMTKIPAIIRDLDDKESSKVALLENLQRKNLNPIEEARTYQKILELDQMTQEELAKTMGKSQSAVANKIRLLSLPDQVQDAILKEQISERHARALLNIPDSKKQQEKLKKIMETKMSVRALEEEIKNEYPKEGHQSEEVKIDSKSAFINSSPLAPTAIIEEEKNEFGKVTIAPPEGEESTMGKYINYGEIKKEEEQEEIPQVITPSVTSIDINQLRNNSSDINKNNNGSALDNLLNLGSSKSTTANDFITPAEKIVKTESSPEIKNKSSDYFDLPELNNMGPHSTILNPGNNDKFISSVSSSNNNLISSSYEEEKTDTYTVEEATEKIRKLVTDLKEHGIAINTDEMNFEKSYQIIIKINKNEE